MAVPILLDGSTPNLQGTNGAAHVLLYGADNTPLVVADKEVLAAGQNAMLTALQNDGVGRLSRGDVTGGTALARWKAMFMDIVDGATVNTQLWTQSLTTMTVTQATRLLTMNATNLTTAATAAIHTSLRQFIKPLGTVLRFSARVRFNWTASGAVEEAGFGNPSGVTPAVPNGAFLRILSNGDVRSVFAYNNVETQSPNALCTVGAAPGQLNPVSWYTLDLFVKDDSMRVVLQRSDDTLSGQIAEAPIVDYVQRFALGTIAEWNAISSPAFFRIYNNTAPTSASNLLYSSVAVMLYDADAQQPWAEQLTVSGRGVLLNPATGAQLANYANSAAPGNATLSNTGVGYSTLGGQFQFATVAGAETDYALFGFQVPTGRTLVVKGVRIASYNTGAAVGATATVMQWGIGAAAAVTLAANSFRKVIGMQVFAAAAPIGAGANDVVWQEAAGLTVQSGQVFHIILKMPIGLATASQVIRGSVVVDGYFE